VRFRPDAEMLAALASSPGANDDEGNADGDEEDGDDGDGVSIRLCFVCLLSTCILIFAVPLQAYVVALLSR
jgi:hypothetical protein